MSDTQLQFKFLDAGAKSSAVIFDPNLDTCNEQTLYLYHHGRDQIIEYRRDIVEAKLRELSPEEAGTVELMRQAFEATRTGFTPRGAAVQKIPEHAPEPKAAAKGSDDDLPEELALIDDSDLLAEDDDDEEDELD